MKKGFTADYWFLAGIWLLSWLLPLCLTGPVSEWLLRRQPNDALIAFNIDIGLLKAIQLKGIRILSQGLQLLSSAAYLVLLIRFWIKPVLPVYLLHTMTVLLPSAGVLFSTIAAGSLRYVVNLLLFPLSGIVTFVLAKLLLKGTAGREWAVFLILLALQKLPLLAIQLLTGRELGAGYLVSLLLHTGKDIVLLTAAYWLMHFCVDKWWSGKKAAPSAENQ